jgi:hypothetical protein
MESRNDLRLPPPWVSPAAGKVAREVRPVIIVPRRRGSLLFYPAYVQDYLDRVTAADVAAGNTQGLERGVTDAFDVALQDLVADEILGISGGVIAQAASKSKAMPFLCGARTLGGCLVPVVGPAPTNFNFLSANYNRKTGLFATAGANMYLDSNRNNNADPQNNKHVAVYTSTIVGGGRYLGTASGLGAVGSTTLASFGGGQLSPYINASSSFSGPQLSIGFYGASRATSSTVSFRNNETTASGSSQSQTPENSSILLFRGGTIYTSCRMSFYSIGEDADLALLDTRVTGLMTALSAAIP